MNVAFIPVRGGSKSIPLKNIRKIAGKPLVYWTVKAACGCSFLDNVYVATDSPVIRETVESFKTESPLFEKLCVIGRSAESASDTASTESAMIEFAQSYLFDNIVLVQATSPLLQSSDLDRGFAKFFEPDTDSVMSVVLQKRFNWDEDDKGIAYPTNYDVFHRPRRQDFKGYYVENGAFYITSRKALLETENRVSGKIRLVEMNEDTFFEIDEPGDWVIIEALMKKNGLFTQKDLSSIRLFLTDCDGCLTDGGMYYSELGDELKKFNTKDGMAFALLKSSGYKVGVVTGETTALNERRFAKLKVDYYVPGCKDKLSAVERICLDMGITLDQVLYVGDDINDLPLLEKVGFSACPADSNEKVKNAVDFVSTLNGGKGVIRELADLLLSWSGT